MGKPSKPKMRIKGKLNGLANGKIKKKSRKLNGKIVKTNKMKLIDEGGDDSIVIKKKPSKSELKSVIEALKKEAKLTLVRKALKYIPYYLKSEGLTKKFLKEIIRLWAEASEKVRVVCLLCLLRVYIKLKDKDLRQLITKKLYCTFLEKCRITKRETMSMIGFMRHSLIEIYKLDPQIAFKQAQSSCQRMTLTLKNATTHKNEETYKTVLNWQFANCLILLSSLITSQDKDSPVKSLTYDVIQLNLGAIRLLTSPRYYPFYCHLIDNLISLSISANLFIPILPLLLSILEKVQIPKMSHKTDKNSNDDEPEKKEYNVDLLNHVSLDESHSLEYNLAVLDKVYELIVRYLASQSHRIAFPELIFLPSVQLKKWIKKNPPGPASQKFKVLLEKIKSDCETLEEARGSSNFAFTNYSAVDAWEKRIKDSNKLTLPCLVNK